MTTVADVHCLLGAGCRLEGDAQAPVTGAAAISSASSGDVTFVSRTARVDALPEHVTASLVIVDAGVMHQIDRSSWNVAAVVSSPNARLDFIRVVSALFAARPPAGIHPSAVIAEGADLGEGVTIGPLVTIADDVTVGGDCVIHAGVHLYPGTRVGARVTIHAGAAIGGDGFGYERLEDGSLIQFPHLGGVIINDDVEIGANTCIDRGTLADTVIESGARIDNLVHIAHNVRVGQNALVIANAVVGGGTSIGAASWIAPSATLRDGLRIGARSTVGVAAVVMADVADESVVVGSPARPLREAKALNKALRALAGSEDPARPGR